MDMRLPPLRCWSCNKPMQEAWGAFCVGAREGKDQAELLNALGLTRYCCRRMVLTHVDLIDKLLAYNTFQKRAEVGR